MIDVILERFVQISGGHRRAIVGIFVMTLVGGHG
jgi:hypothetical protein